jgi:hypothetical protein
MVVGLLPLTWADPPATPVATQPAAPTPPANPGIFGVGFTNITDSSARLVFTTSEPMTSTVVLEHQGKEFSRSNQPNPEEIHSVDLTGLSKGEEYLATITAVSAQGKSVTSEKYSLKPVLRPRSSHTWPGYTIFGSTITGPITAENLDVLEKSGARMARIEPSWDGLYPKPHQLNQTRLDYIVKEVADLKAHNIEPLVILDYCVAWAKPYTDTTMTWRNKNFGPPDRVADWDEYVRTIFTALHGSVKYYEISNEPDAGYLATGSYVERPNMPPPIGRPPFKDNWKYWIGDRYAPMIEQVSRVADEIEPDAILMNGGWNRDYTGGRGDVLLGEGIGSYLDDYAFHTYSHAPISFAGWYGAIDGQFRANIDRIFAKNHVQLPLTVTEWGWPSWAVPMPDKGFVTFEDTQKFYLKSAFYFMGQSRFEILSQFCMGIGSGLRDKDPAFFTLVDQGPDGKLIYRPPYETFHWLATTFSNKPYQVIAVKVTPDNQVKAYAIQLKDSHDTYLALWQDGVLDDKGAIPVQPARDVTVSLGLPSGTYSVQTLDLAGNKISESKTTTSQSLDLKATLPEISSTSESGLYLVKISPKP